MENGNRAVRGQRGAPGRISHRSSAGTAGFPREKSASTGTSGHPSHPVLPAGETERKLKLNRTDLISMQESVMQSFVGFAQLGKSYGGEIFAVWFGR